MKYSVVLEKIDDTVENFHTSKKLLDSFLYDKDESFLNLVTDVQVSIDDDENYYLSFELLETTKIEFLLNMFREIPEQDRETIITYCNVIAYDTLITENFNDALKQLKDMNVHVYRKISGLFLNQYIQTMEELIKEHSLTFKSASVYTTEILKDLCEG